MLHCVNCVELNLVQAFFPCRYSAFSKRHLHLNMRFKSLSQETVITPNLDLGNQCLLRKWFYLKCRLPPPPQKKKKCLHQKKSFNVISVNLGFKSHPYGMVWPLIWIEEHVAFFAFCWSHSVNVECFVHCGNLMCLFSLITLFSLARVFLSWSQCTVFIVIGAVVVPICKSDIR